MVRRASERGVRGVARNDPRLPSRVMKSWPDRPTERPTGIGFARWKGGSKEGDEEEEEEDVRMTKRRRGWMKEV